MIYVLFYLMMLLIGFISKRTLVSSTMYVCLPAYTVPLLIAFSKFDPLFVVITLVLLISLMRYQVEQSDSLDVSASANNIFFRIFICFITIAFTYMSLSNVNSFIGLLLSLEVIFTVSTLFFISHRAIKSMLIYYIIPNFIAGFLFMFFIVGSHLNNLFSSNQEEFFAQTFNSTSILNVLLTLSFILVIVIKLYSFPFSLIVPRWYQSMSMTEITVFSTAFLYPYISIFTTVVSVMPDSYRLVIHVLSLIALVVSAILAVFAVQLKELCAHLSIITHNVIIILFLGSTEAVQQYTDLLCGLFILAYILSIIPFFYSLVKWNITTTTELRTKITSYNLSRFNFTVISFLFLAGYPITFIFMMKVGVLTTFLNNVEALFVFVVYMLSTFSVFIVSQLLQIYFVFFFAAAASTIVLKKTTANLVLDSTIDYIAYYSVVITGFLFFFFFF